MKTAGIQSSRRRFLAGAAASLTILPSARLVRAYAANERLNLAVFGTLYNAEHFLTSSHIYNAQVVALCDPDQRNLAKTTKRWDETARRLKSSAQPEAQAWSEHYARLAKGAGVTFHRDVRRLFDEALESFDMLVVSHYDHLHGVACGPALRAGKPVCSERPLGLNISDARALRARAAETKLPVMYRSPGTGAGQFRRAMELVEEGAIGEVREAHVWFKRGGPDANALPQGQAPVPDELDWNAWLGPLPWREYHPQWMAYAHWRETCSGGLGTFGPHTSVFPFLTLKLPSLWNQAAGGTPIRVSAECERVNSISFPKWERVRWELDAREKMPPVTLTWHHGPEFAPGTRELIHEKLRGFGVAAAEDADALMTGAGSLLIGDEGAMLANDHSVQVTALPAEKFQSLETNRPLRSPASLGIYRDWIDACRGESSRILADFQTGGRLSELLMLGNIATRYPGETLHYDPSVGRITTKAEANEHLGIAYREGWRL